MQARNLLCSVLFLAGFVFFMFGAETLAAEKTVGTGKSFRGPVGIQIYSLRDQIRKDGAPALDFLKEQGFQYVEIGVGNHYGLSKEDMRKALKERGLVPIAAHGGYEFLRDKTEEAIAEAKFFGLKYMGVAWVSHQSPLDEKQVLEIAEVFNEVGKKCKEAGIQFFYHNHGYEFYPYKDGTLFDLLMEKTDPELVKYQMDILWVVHPGQNPVELLKKYPDRWTLVHLKDLKKGVKGDLSGGTSTDNDVVLGTGQVDYPAVLKAAREIGVEFYFIEDESKDVLKQVPQSLKFLETVEF